MVSNNACVHMCLWGVGGFTKCEDENMKKSQGVGLSRGEQ